MSEELKTSQVSGGEGAGQQAPTQAPAASGGSVSPETQQGQAPATAAPEIQAAIEAAVRQVKDEYEGKGGHIARLKSKYDKQIAQLQQVQTQRQQQEYQQAMGLLEAGDYAEAAQILAAQVQTLQGQTMADTQRQQMTDWVERIMGDLGYDLDTEEAATFAAGWTDKLIRDPDLTWDFQQEAARGQIETERQRAKAAADELQKLKEGLPQLVQEQVKRMFTETGLAPDATSDGGGGGGIYGKPSGQLVKEGLAQRRAAARKRK